MKTRVHKHASIQNSIVALIIVCEIIMIAYGKLSLREYKPKSIFGAFHWYKLKFMSAILILCIAFAMIANMVLNIKIYMD